MPDHKLTQEQEAKLTAAVERGSISYDQYVLALESYGNKNRDAEIEKRAAELDAKIEADLVALRESKAALPVAAETAKPSRRNDEPDTETCRRINAFLARVEQETKRPDVKKEMIWRLWNHRSDRQFRDVQAENKEASRAAKKRLEWVLAMNPHSFIAAYDQKLREIEES